MIELATMTISDKPTNFQKMYLILRDFPEIRNSYDLIFEKWFYVYGDDQKRKHIERIARNVQYDAGIFPPSERIKSLRKKAQGKIIDNKVYDKKENKLVEFFKHFIK